MLDKIIEKSPAKINLFLKIINRRDDGFHNIRTGITFIDLYDEITVQPHNKFEVIYKGKFAPKNNQFKDCIINKLFTYINENKPKLLFTISKNFPYEAGLGSASSNVASVIKILENLELIKKKNIFDYVDLGSDIPSFLNQKDALVRGKGDLIANVHFPKYYFLLIRPSFNCSTKKMYNSFQSSDFDYNTDFDLEEINDQDSGNDFEKIIKKNEPEFLSIINFLDDLEDVIFSRLTGSGSCLYSVFEKKEHAVNAQKNFQQSFSNLWTHVSENNLTNLF
ncbi:hypothetical protein OAZ22_01130 [Pelagibacteraceae bacterium]|nr:hypothetical protein [Pelagibacteraceae bacterium]